MSPRRRGHRHGAGHGPGPNGVAAGPPAGNAVVEPAAIERTEQAAPPKRPAGNSAAPAPRTQRTPRNAAERPASRPEPVGTPPATESEEAAGDRKPACTLAQMRRFIKSRPYVPVHELRRRFEIDGIEDEVSPVPTDRGTLFVGLPAQEAGYLAELVKAGDVGCELLLDPAGPAVVGVFPMKPVARQ